MTETTEINNYYKSNLCLENGENPETDTRDYYKSNLCLQNEEKTETSNGDFYKSKLCLKNEEKTETSTCDLKDLSAPPWVPESRSSTDILIEPLEPRLWTQFVAALLACWINLASGASLGYATPALPKLQNDDSKLRITEDEGSWMASIVMLGALGGGMLAGPCISLGRKRALWLTAGPLSFAWILIAIATNTWFLYGAHLIMGLCIGIISDASQIYVSEIASTKCRGALGCVPILMFNVGILICYTAGAWLGWEHLALFGCGITLPALVVPYILPESPSYLVAKGYTKQATAALHWLRGPNFDINPEYQELQNCEKGPPLKERFKDLFARDIFRPLMLTGAIRALSRFCGLRAILCYTQTIFQSSQSSLDAEVTTIVTGAVQLVATLVACGLLDRLGRRKLLITSQAVMGLSLIGLGCYLYYCDDIDGQHGSLLGWLPVVAILLYIVANSIGLGPVSGIIIGEIVPQRHRSIVSSITGAVSWLSAFIITKTFINLRSCLNLHGAIWLYGILCLVGVPFVYLLVPETRGLSQYEIEMLFKEKTDDTVESDEKETEEEVVPEVVVQQASDDTPEQTGDTKGVNHQTM